MIVIFAVYAKTAVGICDNWLLVLDVSTHLTTSVFSAKQYNKTGLFGPDSWIVGLRRSVFLNLCETAAR